MSIQGKCIDDVPTEPGEFAIRQMQHAGGVSGPMFLFGCPHGRGTCGVPVQPSPPNVNGAIWTWDGNKDQPTLSPSINCNGSGCGWHGFVQKGEFTP